jgi:asparagine synthetase B (glutamine-hydrolysing)
VHGGERRRLPEVEDGLTPRAALEDAVLAAMRRPPCVVAFSGGRDSSALLAVASRVAAANGLDPPAAVSFAFPGTSVDETRWQRMVVERLGIESWERIEVRDELDFIGPIATSVLSRHGLLFPPHAHLFAPVLERADGGTVLSGIGGDEVFDRWRYEQLMEVLRRQRAPRPGDLRQAVACVAPEAIRRRLIERHTRQPMSWLTPEATRRARADRARSVASAPRKYDRGLSWLAGRRNVATAIRGIERIARGAGARVAYPFLDDRFMAAVARDGGVTGFGGRDGAWPRMFGDALPEQLVRRPDKATFDAVYFAGPCNDFADRWGGEGAPAGIVDPEGLRAIWRQPFHRLRTGLLVQALWLATRERTAAVAR